MTASGRYELLAQCLVMFCAFVPFFAFKELEEMMGPDESPEPVLEASGCGARSIPPGTGDSEEIMTSERFMDTRADDEHEHRNVLRATNKCQRPPHGGRVLGEPSRHVSETS